MANGGSWGFYGRKHELSELSKLISANNFAVIAVTGGRGVGKSRLIEEAAKSLGSSTPFISLQVPNVPDAPSEVQLTKAMSQLCGNLVKLAGASGIDNALPHYDGTQGSSSQSDFFYGALEGLMKIGAVVVLDEFQHANSLMLASGVKEVIDKIDIGRIPEATGRIVLAGSHQQKLHEMLNNPGAPLYQRVDFFQHLYPLTAPELLEMAADQGWLSRPKRFLAAYTALGGVPRFWRRLARVQQQGILPEPKDGNDESWRKDFATYQIRRLLRSDNEKFFDRSFITLSEEAEVIANELGRHPAGVRWDRIEGLFGSRKDGAREKARLGFRVLWDHLRIVEPAANPYAWPSAGLEKIRLTDQAAMFELSVLPHCSAGARPDLAMPSKKAMDAMSTIEGLALEQLTLEWLHWFPQLDKVKRSVVMKLEDGGQFEIDVVGKTGDLQAPKRCLALCSCKRSPEQHSANKTENEFMHYRELRAKRGDTWEDQNIRWLLVSPEWPADKPRNDKFMRIDFRGMAANLSLRPKPWPLPIPEQHGPDLRQMRQDEPDDGVPDFSM